MNNSVAFIATSELSLWHKPDIWASWYSSVSIIKFHEHSGMSENQHPINWLKKKDSCMENYMVALEDGNN